jgi:hypothetical protein
MSNMALKMPGGYQPVILRASQFGIKKAGGYPPVIFRLSQVTLKMLVDTHQAFLKCLYMA